MEVLNGTVHLQPGQALTVIAPANMSGRLVRLSDAAGGEPVETIPVAAATVTVGPFTKPRRYAIYSDAGTLTYVAQVADLPATVVADPAADTSANFPAGGVGTAAGGWDTSGNRDAAIAAFNALRTLVLSLRAQLVALNAALRASGQIK